MERERESTRGYRNWNRRRGEGQKKGGNSFFRRCLDEKKNLLLLKPLFLSLFSLSPPPPRQQQAGKFTTIKDAQDGYEFAYPFGWQEVT